MTRRGTVALVALVGAAGSCSPFTPDVVNPPVALRFSLVNLSREFYATLLMREHTEGDNPSPFVQTDLLAPGATVRSDFVDFTGSDCPEALDLQIMLYKRVNDDMPIGLDEGEAVEQTPIAAGEIANIPACSVANVFYTIVNWDAPAGEARVKIAQDTPIDDEIRRLGLFAEPDAAWSFAGVDPQFATSASPALAGSEPLSGRVTTAEGNGVAGIGVLIRVRFRVRLDDDSDENDPDSGFSDPIAFTTTDASGAFAFERPAGAYQVEFFSDDFVFRPDSVFVESPIETIRVVADPL